MKITKYEHACLLVEDNGKRLVIDPGDFTSSLPDESYDALFITDAHFDHLGEENVKKLAKANPNIEIYAVDQAADQINQLGIKAQTATVGQKATVAGFQLEFFGGQHAINHPDWPKYPNVGVLVNDTLYYPGDSFDAPGKPVEVLALPDSGPWYKLEYALDLLLRVKPKVCFPTHNQLISEEGKGVNAHFLSEACAKINCELKRLDNGQSLEI